LYLHFVDRTALFLEVSRAVDASERTPERQQRVDHAPTGRDALRQAVALQAWLKPRLHGIATALDALRPTDAAARAAWSEREYARLARCQQVVRRLHAEGDLDPRWDVATAAECMWSLTSQRVWDDLVNGRGWTAARYTTWITTFLEASLIAEGKTARRPRSAASKEPGGGTR
jgi:hypothetical protein